MSYCKLKTLRREVKAQTERRYNIVVAEMSNLAFLSFTVPSMFKAKLKSSYWSCASIISCTIFKENSSKVN